MRAPHRAARRRMGLLGATLLLVSLAGSVEAQDAGLMLADRAGVRVTPAGIRILDALIEDVVA